MSPSATADPRTMPGPEPPAESDATPGGEGVPWYVWAVVFASTSVVVGVIWDISWHRTIGRDTFWTPAHMAIYLGGAAAGLSCGWLVLRTTFAPGAAAERAAGVTFWGFRGPLGAWVCIWGSIAMIASGPFDDWWHNALVEIRNLLEHVSGGGHCQLRPDRGEMWRHRRSFGSA